eukprot:scaffold347511_cov48-Prasinocladus_malaysianus.AAC.1
MLQLKITCPAVRPVPPPACRWSGRSRAKAQARAAPAPPLSLNCLTGTTFNTFHQRRWQRFTPPRAVKDEMKQYQGAFGYWTVDKEDVLEVRSDTNEVLRHVPVHSNWPNLTLLLFLAKVSVYRVGITVATLSLLLASSTAFLPEGNEIRKSLWGLLDPITIFGCLGLGTSLTLIHIYVAPLKRLLQAFFATGVVGIVGIMATQKEPAAQYVVDHPMSVLLVGPLFAAVTGLAFK